MATDPICGMAVDESTSELRLVRDNRTYHFCSTSCLAQFADPQRSLRSLRRRLLVAWPLAGVIVALTYLPSGSLGPPVAAVLAGIVQAYPGLPFYEGTRDAVRSRVWNMDVLIAVATSVAFGYSLAVVVLPGRLPSATYFDASALIVALILTGNYLEHRTRERARGALRRLHDLVPPLARVVRGGLELEVPVAEVVPGDRVIVRSGARFPVDGEVLEGRSAVDEAAVTGEPWPVDKGPGSRVIGGTVNGAGALSVRATRVGEDTALAEITRLVAEAETSRVPLQRLADRLAAVFVPAVLGIAVIAALGWSLAGAGLTIALLVFVSVAITACPCAFGIATPAALVVGTGRAAEEGVVFKGRDSLERASRVDLVLTDKTGTLTRGVPTLSHLAPAPGTSVGELLGIVAGLERGTDHPLGRAVAEAAGRLAAASLPVTDVTEDPGQGIRGRLGRDVVAIRGAVASGAEGVDAGALAGEVARILGAGASCSIVTRGGQAIGVLGFQDEIAPGTREAVDALRRDGIEVVIASGDHAAATERVARELGIRDARSALTPAGKLAVLRELQGRGRVVAFVGDGINDAPTLAAADLGIAIGAGTDVARESGGVILVGERFGGVARALRLGRRTVGKVRGNLAWAVGYNAVLLPIAAGALVPFFGLGIFGLLPITGALAMGLSSTSVVLNSLSLRWVDLR